MLFSSALAIFTAGSFIAVIILAAIGREATGIEFMKSTEAELGAGVKPEGLGEAYGS